MNKTGKTLEIDGKKLVGYKCPGCGHTWYADEATITPNRAENYPMTCPACQRSQKVPVFFADDGTKHRQTLETGHLFCSFDNGWSVMMENTSGVECIGVKLGRKVKFHSPKQLAKDMIADLASNHTPDYNDQESSYFELASRGDAALVGALIKREHGLEKGEKPYFEVHLIDDITGNDCEIQTTEKTTQKELAELLREAQRSLVGELCYHDTLLVLAPGEKRTLYVDNDDMTEDEMEALIDAELLVMELGPEIMTDEYARKVFGWYSSQVFDGGELKASTKENTLRVSAFLGKSSDKTQADCSLRVSNESDIYTVVDVSDFFDPEIAMVRGNKMTINLIPYSGRNEKNVSIPKLMAMVENNGGLVMPLNNLEDLHIDADKLMKEMFA